MTLQKFFQMTISAALALAITACKDFDGSLVTNEKVSLRSSGDLVAIQPGTYNAILKVKSKKRIQMEISLPQGKTIVDFKTTQNLNDLKPGDKIAIAAKDSGQPYDVSGIYDIQHSSTESIQQTESCTYYTTEFSCEDIDVPPSCETVSECGTTAQGQPICKDRQVCSGGGWERQCGDHQIPHTGAREVEYSISTATEIVHLNLLGTDKRILGQFSASDAKSHRNYSFEGTCQ